MAEVVRDAVGMIGGMSPILDARDYVFCTTADAALAERVRQDAIAWYVEEEGVSIVLPADAARALRFDCSAPMRRITLRVFSALDGVELTAAVATALAAHGIACNMIAAYHHDHVFVPSGEAERALAVLRALQASVGGA